MPGVKKLEVSVFMDGGILVGKYDCKTLDQLNWVLEKARKHGQVKVVQVISIEGGPEEVGFDAIKMEPYKLTRFTYVIEDGEWTLIRDSEFCPEGARKLYK